MKNILTLSLLICITLFGCKTKDINNKSSDQTSIALVGTKWVLIKLNGDVVQLNNPQLTQPFIKLSEDKNIGGNGGCNSFGGSYTLTDKNAISFSKMISTLRYCEDQGIESAFIGNLQKTASYGITKNELILKDENGHILAAFEPVSD